MKLFEEVELKLKQFIKEYDRTCELLTYEEVLLDTKLTLKLQEQARILSPSVLKYKEYLKLSSDIEDLNNLIEVSSSDERQLINEEIQLLNKKIDILKVEIARLLSTIEANEQIIVIEVVANKDILSDRLAFDLIKGYTNYCKNNSFCFSLTKEKNINRLQIQGLNVKDIFKYEIGQTQAKDANNESFCQVFVYDDINQDVSFLEEDLKISTTRSSGAGGQHINTTDSAVRVTHLKTGISVLCQDERSQFQNKEIAILRLKDKVLEYYKKEKLSSFAKQKKDQLKSFNQNKFVKVFDYTQDKIFCKNKKVLLLQQFLDGKSI